MLNDKIDENRERFKKLLFKLALRQDTFSSSQERRNIYLELEEIYYGDADTANFRHFYSDIFAVLSQIDDDISLGNLEILSQNMELVRKGYKPMNQDKKGKLIDISMPVNKLYDHINLDIARINYFKKTEMRSYDELQKVMRTTKELEEKTEDMKDAVEKVDEMQKQYITILGIFASIVLAFTGGIAFSTSVLENIGNASIYRVVLIATGLAFVLLNIIYVLTRFVQEIAKKNTDEIKYPVYMKTLNGVCIAIVIVIIVCWWFDLSRAAGVFQNWLY